MTQALYFPNSSLLRDIEHPGSNLKTLSAELTFKNGDVLKVSASAPNPDASVQVNYSGDRTDLGRQVKTAALGFLEFWLRGISLSNGACIEISHSGTFDEQH